MIRICMYVHVCVHIYIYIYIYRERERARERDIYIVFALFSKEFIFIRLNKGA